MADKPGKVDPIKDATPQNHLSKDDTPQNHLSHDVAEHMFKEPSRLSHWPSERLTQWRMENLTPWRVKSWKFKDWG